MPQRRTTSTACCRYSSRNKEKGQHASKGRPAVAPPAANGHIARVHLVQKPCASARLCVGRRPSHPSVIRGNVLATMTTDIQCARSWLDLVPDRTLRTSRSFSSCARAPADSSQRDPPGRAFGASARDANSTALLFLACQRHGVPPPLNATKKLVACLESPSRHKTQLAAGGFVQRPANRACW